MGPCVTLAVSSAERWHYQVHSEDRIRNLEDDKLAKQQRLPVCAIDSKGHTEGCRAHSEPFWAAPGSIVLIELV